MTIGGVIFDLDGTLADTLPVCYAAFRSAFQEFTGRTYTDEEIAALFGPSEEGAIRRVVPDRAEECLRLFLTEYEQAHTLCKEPFPGIIDALQMLKRCGVQVAVVTGKGEHSAAISLRLLGLAPYFDIVEAGSAEGAIKPQAIRKVIALWGLPGQEVAYVGDAPSDVTSAREAGVLPLAAGWAATAKIDAIKAREPLALFRTVESFIDWMEEKVEC